MMIDLSKFKNNYVKDTPEEIQEILAMTTVKRIPEGVHEVKITGFHEKDGQKLKMIEKYGGSIAFSVIVKTKQNEEQLIYMLVPVGVTFRQAVAEENNFMIKKIIGHLNTIGIRPDLLRSAMIDSNGAALQTLIGAEFVIENKWDPKQLHIEYDQNLKANFFVKGDGTRFESGEMAVPVVFDKDKKGDERWAPFVALAKEHNFKLATQMFTNLLPHPEVSNEVINEKLAKFGKQEEKKVINKTPSAFPPFPKKVIAPIDIEGDMDLG
jgi:hypothetical protein